MTKWTHSLTLIGMGVVLGCSDPVFTRNPIEEFSGAVIVSDFSTGQLVPLRDNPRTAVPTHSDAIVRRRSGGGWLVVNRLGADNLQWVTDAWELEHQISVGKGTNPQDALEWGRDVWVSHLRRKDLVRWNGKGEQTGRVLLCTNDPKTSHCDGDGYAEPTYFLRRGERFFVVLQRLDVSAGYVPAGGSRILEVDGERGTVLGHFALHFQNPVTPLKPLGGRVLIGGAGKFGEPDGGIESWDLERGEGYAVVTEEALGGDLVDFAPTGEREGVAIVARDNTTFLVSYAHGTVGAMPAPWTEAGGFFWMQVRFRDGKLYLVDRNPRRPGIHQFRPDGTTEGFWAMPLPPYWMEFR